MNKETDYTIASTDGSRTTIVAQVTHSETIEYGVPVDPMDELGCVSCQ
jgi:hypothetical protein